MAVAVFLLVLVARLADRQRGRVGGAGITGGDAVAAARGVAAGRRVPGGGRATGTAGRVGRPLDDAAAEWCPPPRPAPGGGVGVGIRRRPRCCRPLLGAVALGRDVDLGVEAAVGAASWLTPTYTAWVCETLARPPPSTGGVEVAAVAPPAVDADVAVPPVALAVLSDVLLCVWLISPVSVVRRVGGARRDVVATAGVVRAAALLVLSAVPPTPPVAAAVAMASAAAPLALALAATSPPSPVVAEAPPPSAPDSAPW